MVKQMTIHKVTRIAMVAAIYVVLTWVLAFMSYDSLQLRLAEVLILLSFYKKEYGPGIIIGCFIANLNSPMLVYDLTLGVLSTIIPVILIRYTKSLALAALWPVIFVGLLVGLELHLAYDSPWIIMGLQVAIGEAIVMVIGYLLFRKLESNQAFMQAIGAEPAKISPRDDFMERSGLSILSAIIITVMLFVWPMVSVNSEEVTFFAYYQRNHDYSSFLLVILPLLAATLVFFIRHRKSASLAGLLLFTGTLILLATYPVTINSGFLFLLLLLIMMINLLPLIPEHGNNYSKKR